MGGSKGKSVLYFPLSRCEECFIPDQQCFMKHQSIIKYSYPWNSSCLCKQPRLEGINIPEILWRLFSRYLAQTNYLVNTTQI